MISAYIWPSGRTNKLRAMATAPVQACVDKHADQAVSCSTITHCCCCCWVTRAGPVTYNGITGLVAREWQTHSGPS